MAAPSMEREYRSLRDLSPSMGEWPLLKISTAHTGNCAADITF